MKVMGSGEEASADIFLFALACIFILLFGYVKKYALDCNDRVAVVQVGSCDEKGRCGVRYSDGTFGDLDHPIVNKTLCLYH